MLSPVKASGGFNPTTGALLQLANPRAGDPAKPLHGDGGELQARFQDFVAGAFYKTMLKSLRDGQKPPQYFYGGQTEQIFQQHFDEQLAEALARDHGAHLAAPFYDLYSTQLGRTATAEGKEAGHALDVAA